MKHFLVIAILIIVFSGHDAYCKNDTPENVVKNFYIWYLNELAKESKLPVPYNDAIYQYVDKCLIKKVCLSYKIGIVDADYFTDSQDSIEDYRKTIKIYDAIKINEKIFVVPVNLAPQIIKSAHLLVFLEKENEKFRIIKVRNFEWIEIK
jgi:hypothetical protein